MPQRTHQFDNAKIIIFRWNTILKQEFYTEKSITFNYVWKNNLKSVSLYLRILQYTMINQQKKAINRIKAVLAEKQLSGEWNRSYREYRFSVVRQQGAAISWKLTWNRGSVESRYKGFA